MKRKFAEGGGIGSFMKQKVNKAKTAHGVGLAFPMANLDKMAGKCHGGTVMAAGGLVGCRGDGIAQRGKTRARGCK